MADWLTFVLNRRFNQPSKYSILGIKERNEVINERNEKSKKKEGIKNREQRREKGKRKKNTEIKRYRDWERE